jgi:predicted Zn finger-like uncharacterized protein
VALSGRRFAGGKHTTSSPWVAIDGVEWNFPPPFFVYSRKVLRSARMKFLCDNCKAKYQIADEKVAGRTVRMKCRKCSHLIEIRASVTETSVALSAPPAGGGAVGEATMQVSVDALTAPRPATGTGPATPASAGARAPSAAGKVAPRPGSGGGALRGASSGQLSAVKPGAQKAEPSGLAAGGLAGAFSDSVKSEPGPAFEESPTHALDMASGSLTEEWYVGINGVPVGPVRLTEFRAKIQSGAVTGDSLVWREGFEEWLPLRNFPELNEILKSSTQSDRSPLGGRPGSGSGARPLSAIASSALRSKSSASMSAVSTASASSVAPVPTSGSRSNVVAFGKGATATAEKLELQPEPQAEPPAPIADPFAVPAPVADPFAAPVPVVAVPVAANFAPVPEPAVVPAAPTEAPQQRRGGIPIAGWIAIAAALGLGVAAGSVLSSKAQPPPPTVQIVTVSAVAPPAPVPTDTATAAPDTSAAPTASIAAVTATAKTGGTGKVAVVAPEKTADPPPTPTVGTVGAIPAVGGVGAVGAVGGPSPGPSPTTGGGGGAEKLTGEQVSSVVNAGKNALRRACWEPALSARAPNGPSSARVTVNMTIGPDGRVKSASASGGDGFPTLASCIGSRVRSWVFPTSQSTTQTAPSFSFVAQ